jgi:hypothetical protein
MIDLLINHKMGIYKIDIFINHKILSYNGYYKIINSANMILYCKDSLGCIDNNNIELINKVFYIRFTNKLVYVSDKLT